MIYYGPYELNEEEYLSEGKITAAILMAILGMSNMPTIKLAQTLAIRINTRNAIAQLEKDTKELRGDSNYQKLIQQLKFEVENA